MGPFLTLLLIDFVPGNATVSQRTYYDSESLHLQEELGGNKLHLMIEKRGRPKPDPPCLATLGLPLAQTDWLWGIASGATRMTCLALAIWRRSIMPRNRPTSATGNASI